MTVEMAASRLVAPYFGTTLIVWTLLIGIVMTALAVGTWFGGRRADRTGSPHELHGLLVAAGLALGTIPFLASPVLSGAQRLQSLGGIAGSFLGIAALLSLPVALLGMTTPYAVGLLARGRGTGSAAGTVWSLSAAGSILGTCLPAMVLVPLVGTKSTILLAAGLLAVAGLSGLGRPGLAVAACVAVALLWGRFSSLKSAPGMIHAEESPYNYIQVMDGTFAGNHDDLTRRYLVLNEGFAYHSVYAPDAPDAPFTGDYYDYLALVPLLAYDGKPLRAASIGLGAGTVAHQWIWLYDRTLGIAVDGVELDPQVIEVGRRHFGLRQAEASGHLRCYAEDGRTFLRRRPDARYDVVCVDVYRQPYIPFHLATREFFELLREHLAPGGVVAMNVGTLDQTSDFFQSFLATMSVAFGDVHWFDVRGPDGVSYNCLVLAGRDALRFSRLDPDRTPLVSRLAGELRNPTLVAQCAKALGCLRHYVPSGAPPSVFTDDRSAIEHYTLTMAVGFVKRATQAELERQRGLASAGPAPDTTGGGRP